MKTGLNKSNGFTLVEIMIVVAIIGLLAAIAIPNLVHARTRSQTNTCITNLRSIDHAIAEWALEHKRSADDPVTFSDLREYFRREVTCPVDQNATFDTSYAVTTVGTVPTCRVLPSTHVLQ